MEFPAALPAILIPVTSLSFTGRTGMRYPAPDVARGFMLLLIALANVPYWMPTSSEVISEAHVADRVWLFVRGALIDQRAYPLFALLFGFGLMTMINRKVSQRMSEGMPLYLALEDARSLIRRRGWWMLLIGAVHALFFAGDIIGTYALVALILAGLLVTRNFKALTWISAGVVVLAIGFAWLAGIIEQWAGAYTSVGGDLGGQDSLYEFGLWMPLLGFIGWCVSTPLAVIASLVIPGVVIGAWLANTDLISNPREPKNRRTLTLTAASGLSLAVLGAIPDLLPILSPGARVASWAAPLTMLAGLFGALGWMALMSLWAGPAAGQLRGVRGFVANVGQRSMTAYLLQTLFFLVIFVTANATGVAGRITALGGAGIAVLVWFFIALLCHAMAARGKRGPMETLLRKLVARGNQPEPRWVG